MDERTSLIIAMLLGAMTIMACGRAGAPSPPAAPTVTIEDGVRVVDNHAPVWDEDEAWRIAGQPSLTLGTETGAPWEMLTYPRAIRLRDGRIVVTDGMAKEIHYYAVDGSHLFTRGGEGEGPGEYLTLWQLVATPDDALLAYDPQLQRHTLYERNGELAGTLPLADHDEPYWRPRIIGAFTDASLLGEAGQQVTADRWLDLPPNTIGWYYNGLFRYDADGASPHFLGRYERSEATSREGQNIAFEAAGFVAPGRGGYCHAMGREFEIRCFDPAGTLMQRIRWPGEPAAVTEADRERYTARSRENVGDTPHGERWIRETIWAETVPVLHDLRLDATGNIWAERHIGLLHTHPVNLGTGLFTPDASPWEVFAADGTWLGRIELPPGREVQQIGEDWILLAGEDDAGVHHVWLYDLIKP